MSHLDYNENGSSSEESVANKQQEASDVNSSSEEEGEDAYSKGEDKAANVSKSDAEASSAVTRKSKRVKTLNRKYSQSGNDDQEELTTRQPDGLNGYNSPSKSGQQARQKKVLNNRLNENYSPKKESPAKRVKLTADTDDSLKEHDASIDENTECHAKRVENLNNNSNNDSTLDIEYSFSHTREEFR